MGLLTFTTNVTLDGCIDHREGFADDETQAFFNRLLDESAAMTARVPSATMILFMAPSSDSG